MSVEMKIANRQWLLWAALAGLFAGLATPGGRQARAGEAPPPAAQPPAAVAPPAGEVGFAEIAEFKLSYPSAEDAKHALYDKHPRLPRLEDAAQLQVRLGKVADGYVAPRAGVETVSFALADAPKQALKKYYASAILSIEEQLVAWFNARGLIAVFVATHPSDMAVQLDRDGKPTALEDHRGTRKDLRLVVWVGVVTKVRTIASGARVPKDARVDNPAHARIKARSPVKPASEVARNDLLDREALEQYTAFLSRHPGRRVDVALSSDDRPGGVVLDYLVSENRPWYAYIQASNTGTKYTRPWRERFGFVHNQLTGRDDILTLDYTTAGFDKAHAVTLSYEAPVFSLDRLRWRTYASWSKYTASDVGVASAEYRGKSCSFGAEMLYNIFQRRAFFLDTILGARWERLRVEDRLLEQTGEDDLLIPYFGFRLQRITEVASTWGSLIVERNTVSIPNTERSELERLGRSKPDLHYQVLKYELSHSFYLEPLLNPKGWENPTTWRSATLAHELAFWVRGQHSMGSRLIPQQEMVAGGAYTVRGYPESVLVGDSVCVASAEYRFHVPRLFKPRPEPAKLPVFNQPFRFAPQQVYGRPDWDLVLRAFYDIGRGTNVHRQTFERDRTIRGTGLGAELRIKDNFSIRCDYGVALDDVVDPVTDKKRVHSGEHRFHTTCTLAF